MAFPATKLGVEDELLGVLISENLQVQLESFSLLRDKITLASFGKVRTVLPLAFPLDHFHLDR